MGWVKKEVISDYTLLEELKSHFTDKFQILNGVRKSCSSSVYEYLTDFIKDYYDVTICQCHSVAKKLADFYGIKKLYAYH